MLHTGAVSTIISHVLHGKLGLVPHTTTLFLFSVLFFFFLFHPIFIPSDRHYINSVIRSEAHICIAKLQIAALPLAGMDCTLVTCQVLQIQRNYKKAPSAF